MSAYRKWTMRYVSTIPLTGAVRGSRGQAWSTCPVSGREDQDCQMLTRARRDHSAAYASMHVSPNSVPWVSLYKEHQGLLLRGRL